MDEQELRTLVRAAIARHHGAAPAAPVTAAALPSAMDVHSAGHVSVARFVIARGPGESECVIEPSVTCNHCGHCLCYGH